RSRTATRRWLRNLTSPGSQYRGAALPVRCQSASTSGARMTMQVAEALEILGAKRVIWIDDRFNATPAQLAALLTNSVEIAQACEFPELQDALASYEIDATGALHTITQILADLGSERMEEIRAAFFAKEKAEREFATNEL